MDKQYLFENNLYNAHKHFRHLSEWNRSGKRRIDEAGPGMPPPEEDPNAGDGEMGGDPGMGGAPGGDMGGDPGMGGAPSGDMGADPSMGGAPSGDMGGDPRMGGAPEGDMGGDPGMGGPDDMGAPSGDMMGGPDDMGGPEGMEPDEEEEEDDVIDVDDLTKAQQKTSDTVNKVGRNLEDVDNKIIKMAHMIDSLEKMIDSQNKDIMDLRKEFVKRNPTQTEKLNLRSLDSYPFNVQPTDYWDNINKSDGNYEAYSDNEEPTIKEYEITNDDVDDYNEADIANSFDIGDDMDQTIKKIFGI